MSISFIRGTVATSMRRLAIRMPDDVWEQIDRLVAESEKDGAKINVEATVAAALQALVAEATGGKRRRARKEVAAS